MNSSRSRYCMDRPQNYAVYALHADEVYLSVGTIARGASYYMYADLHASYVRTLACIEVLEKPQ